MTRGRKPRQLRTRVHSPLQIAVHQVARLTKHQVARVIDPVRAAFVHLRQGVATEIEWAYLVSAMNIADSVAITSPIKGARAHIEAAQHALDGIAKRAMATGEWHATDLHFQELDHLKDGVDIYHHQLQHISRGEYERAEAHAAADVMSTAAGAGITLHHQHPAGEQLALLEG